MALIGVPDSPDPGENGSEVEIEYIIHGKLMWNQDQNKFDEIITGHKVLIPSHRATSFRDYSEERQVIGTKY